jgi:hypothetical protein
MASPKSKHGTRAGTGRCGTPAGVIPAFRVYGDAGHGLKPIYHPVLRTDRFSRIVANETVRTLLKTGTFNRLVITHIEG